MGPLSVNDIISGDTNFLLAFFIGIGFGFVLEQAGFSSSRRLAGVFYGYDMTVLKVFFTGAVTAMLGMLFFGLFGWMDLSLIYVNPTFLTSAIFGGVIMGAGFILGGYCPGTSFCGAAIGKVDAMLFIGGLFIGVYIWGFGFDLWKDMYVAGNMGSPKLGEWLGISDGVMALVIVIIAIGAFFMAEWVESLSAKKEESQEIN
ncbi:MAG: YeeE/YedE family protein [Bacteroidetes bacterium]|nr:YeeE/YedE family protein [Bacteroidota bacterium]